MGPDTYAVAHAEQLLTLPGPPQTVIQRELLSEYLRNPFLDDDIQGLALRTGRRRDELLEALEVLMTAGLLQAAGRRGYMLDLERLELEVEHSDKILVLSEVDAAAKMDESHGDITAAEQLVSASGAPDLLEVLPFGAALIRPDGVPLMANAAIGRLLGLNPFDGAGFAARTGCDLALVCEGEAATTFSLEDDGLEIQVQPCHFAGKSLVLVLVQDQSLQREITRAHVQIQEELFGELRGEVAEPLQLFRNFLENPDAAGLDTARAAFKQIEMFLQAFLLTSPPEDQ